MIQHEGNADFGVHEDFKYNKSRLDTAQSGVGCGGQQTFDDICFRVPPCHQTLAGSGAVILESRKVCYRLGRDGVLDETGYCTIRGTGFKPVFRVLGYTNPGFLLLKTGFCIIHRFLTI